MNSNCTDWHNKPLAGVAELVMGQSPESKYYSAEEKGLPFLQGCAEFQSRFPKHVQCCTQIKKIAPQGAILFSVRAPVGKINIADQEYIIGRGIAGIIGIEVDQDYLEHYLQFQEQKFQRSSQGSTFEAINSSELSSWPVAYPSSKPEQTKIAKVLSTVDRAIKQTEVIIAKQQRIKTGLMQDLLTRGIDEQGNIRSEETHEFKDSPLGRIPVEWEVWEIGELCSNIVDCPHTTPIYTASGIPCIRTADMVPGGLLINSTFYVSEKTYLQRISRLKPEEGDIIYSREGERLGIASPVGDERLCLGQRVMLLRPSLKTDPNFLLWSMNEQNFYTRVTKGLGATTSPHINVKDIRKTLVRRAETKEQKIIGRILAKQHHEIQKDSLYMAKLFRVKTALMQDLLTGKVRVSLDE